MTMDQEHAFGLNITEKNVDCIKPLRFGGLFNRAKIALTN